MSWSGNNRRQQQLGPSRPNRIHQVHNFNRFGDINSEETIMDRNASQNRSRHSRNYRGSFHNRGGGYLAAGGYGNGRRTTKPWSAVGILMVRHVDPPAQRMQGRSARLDQMQLQHQLQHGDRISGSRADGPPKKDDIESIHSAWNSSLFGGGTVDHRDGNSSAMLSDAFSLLGDVLQPLEKHHHLQQVQHHHHQQQSSDGTMEWSEAMVPFSPRSPHAAVSAPHAQTSDAQNDEGTRSRIDDNNSIMRSSFCVLKDPGDTPAPQQSSQKDEGPQQGDPADASAIADSIVGSDTFSVIDIHPEDPHRQSQDLANSQALHERVIRDKQQEQQKLLMDVESLFDEAYSQSSFSLLSGDTLDDHDDDGGDQWRDNGDIGDEQAAGPWSLLLESLDAQGYDDHDDSQLAQSMAGLSLQSQQQQQQQTQTSAAQEAVAASPGAPPVLCVLMGVEAERGLLDWVKGKRGCLPQHKNKPARFRTFTEHNPVVSAARKFEEDTAGLLSRQVVEQALQHPATERVRMSIANGPYFVSPAPPLLRTALPSKEKLAEMLKARQQRLGRDQEAMYSLHWLPVTELRKVLLRGKGARVTCLDGQSFAVTPLVAESVANPRLQRAIESAGKWMERTMEEYKEAQLQKQQK